MQTATINNQTQYRTRKNQFIRVPQVRVILEDGTSPGIMDTRDALKMAQDLGLDLIEINPKSIPPVCKIADHGKMLYEEKKKQQAAKKNQTTQELKELNCKPNTDEADFQRLIDRAREFLLEKNKVRMAIKFRGREISHPEIGRLKLEKFVKDLDDVISMHTPISLENKNMSVVISPK